MAPNGRNFDFIVTVLPQELLDRSLRTITIVNAVAV